MNTSAMCSARTFPTERFRQEASGLSSVWPIEGAGVDPLYCLGHPQVQLVASRQGEAADQGLADELMGDDEAGSGSSLAATMRWARSASSIASRRASVSKACPEPAEGSPRASSSSKLKPLAR